VTERHTDTWHISRSFVSTHLEDACPCPQEECGFVARDRVDPACLHHPVERGKTIRRAHRPDACPGSQTHGAALTAVIVEEISRMPDDDDRTYLTAYADDLVESLEQLRQGDVRLALTVAEARLRTTREVVLGFVPTPRDGVVRAAMSDALNAYRDAVLHDAAQRIRIETQRVWDNEILEREKFRPCRDAADQIDPDIDENELYY
jgi:hypothetical protein